MKKILTTIKNFFLQIFKREEKSFTVGSYHMGIGKMEIEPKNKREEKLLLKNMTQKEVEAYFKQRATGDH